MMKANRLRYTASLLLGILACASSPLLAQSGQPLTAPSGIPEFDVASIRASVAETVPSRIANSANNGEFNAVNVTLRDLMEVAFALPETQMFGGPDWTATTRFDVKATADPAVTQQLAALPADQARLRKRQMVQALLLDRFKVSAHKENREMPAYSLVIAKGGPKLASTTSAATALSGGRGRISIKGGNDSLAVLSFELSWRLGRPVIERTGLQGRYEITLTWAADDDASTPATESNAPSLFTAIQEQLGLRLQPDKGPVPVLIIDHAEKPSVN